MGGGACFDFATCSDSGPSDVYFTAGFGAAGQQLLDAGVLPANQVGFLFESTGLIIGMIF